MFLRLLFLLTVIPFIEIYFIMRLSESIGWMNTILIIFVTGVLGASLLKRQGHSILMELQKSSQQNQLPSEALAKGFFTFIGGLLLLTPGTLTDVLGLSLILPLTQKLWKAYFMRQWQNGVRHGGIKFYSNMGSQGPRSNENPFEPIKSQRRFDPSVIDVEASKAETIDRKED